MMKEKGLRSAILASSSTDKQVFSKSLTGSGSFNKIGQQLTPVGNGNAKPQREEGTNPQIRISSKVKRKQSASNRTQQQQPLLSKKPPRNPSKGPVSKKILPVDHVKQRAKLLGLIQKAPTEENAENRIDNYEHISNQMKSSQNLTKNGSLKSLPKNTNTAKAGARDPSSTTSNRNNSQGDQKPSSQESRGKGKNDKTFNIRNNKVRIRMDLEPKLTPVPSQLGTIPGSHQSTGTTNTNNTVNDSPQSDVQEQQTEQLQIELEKDQAVQDKFELMSFGLRLRASITRRRHILEVVEELKHRFRKLLYMYQDKKSQQAFLELKSMIENYDKKEIPKGKPQLGGKFSKQALRAKIPDCSLLTVEEREEEYDLTTYRASNDSILKRDHPQSVGNSQQLDLSQHSDEQNLKKEQLSDEGQLRKEDHNNQSKDYKSFQEQDEEKKTEASRAKVKMFLLMVLHRRRYQKYKNQTKDLRSSSQSLRSSQQEPIRTQSEIPFEVQGLVNEQHSDDFKNRPLLTSEQQAVFRIKRAWAGFKQRQEGKEIRDYLKTIPYECRRSYVKYYDLKFKTNQLKTQVNTMVKGITL